MQLKNLGNLSEVLNSFKVSSAAVGNTFNSMDLATQKFILSCGKLSETQLAVISGNIEWITTADGAIVSTSGLTKAELDEAVATATLSASQKTATGSTSTLGLAFQGLAAKIGISTTALGIFTGAMIAIGVGLVAVKAYKQHMEEIRQATEEAANSFKESSSSIDDYVSRYKDLQQALKDAKGNEEETYNVKKQLLDLQTELNEKFGDEYGRLSLLTDAYKDQTEAIKAYNKEAAQTYLNENQKGIKDAEKQMSKERHYNLSGVGISQYTEAGSALRDIAEQYKNQGVSLLDNEDGTYSVHLNADATSAYDTINSFENDLREKAKELGDEHLFDDVLEVSSESLNGAKDVIGKYADIYREALTAEIIKDDGMSAKYQEALQAVETYNEALLKSEDPYNDENVAKARQNLQSIKAELTTGEWEKYGYVINDVFDQADTHLLDFYEDFKNDSGLQKFSQDLVGLQDLDLRAMWNDDIHDSFDSLANAADNYGVSVEELIDLLVRLGIVQSTVADGAGDVISSFNPSQWDTLNKQIDSIQSAYKALYSASEEYNQYGYVTADTLQTLLALDSEYLACLIDENGQLAINGTTYQNLVQAKLADAEATAVQQTIEELGKVTVESKTQADITSIGVIGEKANALAALSGSYGAVAESAYAAANAEALVAAYGEASSKNQAEADKIMSNLNAKLALIQSTAKNTAGSFGALTNHLNGFSSASGKAADATDALTEAMEKQKKALEDQKSALEEQKQHYEDVYSAIKWFYDKQIDKQQKCIDNLEKQNELLELQLGNYDDAISAVERFYDSEIDKIQEKIDALDKANTAAEKEIAIEKAKQALEEARNNKSRMIYTKNRGFIYQADQDAIASAEDDLASANEDKIKYDLQAQIDKLQEYKKLWSEIPDAYEQAQQDMMMKQLLGANWEYDLLNGRIEAITTFKENYIAIQTEINSNEELIASYEEKIEYYESLKEQWEDLTSKFEEETYTQLLIGQFGNDYENELLNGRTSRWDQFANDYYNIQVQLKDVTDQIESLAKRMEEYASRMEAAASRANAAISSVNGVSGSGSSGFTYMSMNAGTYKGKAKGGIITKRDAGDLDFIAKSIGEDHMIGIQNDEAVIPKESVRKNPEVVNALINGDDLEKLGYEKLDIPNINSIKFSSELLSKYANYSPNINIPKWDAEKYVNNNQQQKNITLSIGDIHVHGVQEPNGLSRAIINQLPNAIMQELNRR